MKTKPNTSYDDTGVFAGSFDPFTRGHRNIVEQALRVFDRVTVLVADNPAKTYMFDMEERINLATAGTEDFDQVSVQYLHKGSLVGDWVKDYRPGATLVRGIRDGSELLYESEVDAYNRRHFGLQSVLFMAQYACSSTNLRGALEAWIAGTNGEPSAVLYPTEKARNIVRSWAVSRGAKP